MLEGPRQRKATLVAPQGLLLTTQEAADFLGISRPTLVKLLEDGAVAFEKPNRHRRVRLQDLIDFQHRRRTERRAVLDQLTAEAGELGPYDATPDRHAVVVAMGDRADAIVTANVGDYPMDVLGPLGIEVVHPDPCARWAPDQRSGGGGIARERAGAELRA